MNDLGEILRLMSPEEKCHDQGMWKPNFCTIPAISKHKVIIYCSG